MREDRSAEEQQALEHCDKADSQGDDYPCDHTGYICFAAVNHNDNDGTATATKTMHLAETVNSDAESVNGVPATPVNTTSAFNPFVFFF